MANLKTTDSPVCRRIVLAFLDFLDSVEAAPGVDLEGLEVAKECLAEVFKINPSSVDGRPEPDLLFKIFSSEEAIDQHESKLDVDRETADAPSTSARNAAAHANVEEASRSLEEQSSSDGNSHTSGTCRDELFGQFFGALEKINYFKSTSDGHDDQIQLDRATQLFQNAVAEMENSGCQTYDQKSLAETLKLQGNKAMQSKHFSEAIELYSCAVALCENNAVYYCNRAAAYTQMRQYTEAIRDCHKSIEVDPHYSKAYSRLGFAYYAQGKYVDAITKGFLRALQLDPNNESVKENIRAAEQKLREEQQRAERNQNSSSASHQQESSHQSSGGPRSHAVPPMFTSMPFGANGLPADIASMFMNMASNVHQGQHPQDWPEAAGNNSNTFSEPVIRVGGNVNVNLGDQMPEELSGALRSVMEMFSGAPQQGSPQDNMNGRSAPS